MTSFAHPGTRGLSTVFGLMMVGSAAVGSHGLAVVVGLPR
ncbi:integral membrane protein [Mycobacterium tuberculosis]|nr:integral membrane protein [Mycobacterium tuberculosis]